MPVHTFKKSPALAAALSCFLLAASNSAALADGHIGAIDWIVKPKHDMDVQTFFNNLDLDKDGKVTRAEYQAQRMYNFGLRDTNEDGKLTADEIPSFRQSLLDAIDANKDGAITAFEFHQATVTRFKVIDLNADQIIAVEELEGIFELYKKP